MKAHKKYMDIIRFGKSGTTQAIQEGTHISITEKLDGANASFTYDKEATNGVQAFSRRQVLDEEESLNGFFQWVQTNIAPIKENLVKNYRYYGEWLVKHSVTYNPTYYRNFYLFSVWDEDKEEYLSDEVVKQEAERLGLKTVPFLYEGEFISFEHIMSFVGKSNMTLEPNKGEGVVVKDATYKNRYGHQLFVKFIATEFSEVAQQKVHNVDTELLASLQKVDMVATKNRTEKMLLKLVDEGIIPSDYSLKKDMGLILREMNLAIYDDIMKEESDELEGLDEKTIRKRISKVIPTQIRGILVAQGRDK